MRNVSSVEKEGYEGIHLKFCFRSHVAPVPRFQLRFFSDYEEKLESGEMAYILCPFVRTMPLPPQWRQVVLPNLPLPLQAGQTLTPSLCRHAV